MSNPRTARRTVAVSAAFLLAFGGVGVAASAAFADTAPAGTSSEAPEAADPAYTLTSNGAGSYSLAITIPGTSIAVDYTVDPTGAVTSATTSTSGATVAVDGHDLTVTLADGRQVKVELGDAGDDELEVSVENPDTKDTEDAQGDEDTQDTQDAQDEDQNDETDGNEAPHAPKPAPAIHSGDSSDDSADTETDSPESSDSSDDGGSDS